MTNRGHSAQVLAVDRLTPTVDVDESLGQRAAAIHGEECAVLDVPCDDLWSRLGLWVKARDEHPIFGDMVGLWRLILLNSALRPEPRLTGRLSSLLKHSTRHMIPL